METKNLFPIRQQDLAKTIEPSAQAGNGSPQFGEAGKASYPGLIWNRLFGSGNPYETINWEVRTAKITKGTGEVVFEQKDVEVPDFWTQTATDIVASKYFRGQLGTPQRENSARQMVDRVADTIAAWGFKGEYFKTLKDYENFHQDLKFLLINQFAAFNSPVWFNVGVYERPQCSACFILSVEDNMQSILDWYRDEGWIFKFGSGSGINLSKLRSSREPLSRGGRSSGPISFMKGADGVANSIRSGGTTRRAAKMVILNAEHPDIKDFIYCKKIIEDMTKALELSGMKASIEGELFNPYTLLPYQNANNSVRATDDFMRQVETDDDWGLKSVTTGEVLETVKAREVMNWIADAAWHSADPGMQFDTIINDWHTCPASGKINGSNPCFTGDTLVYTDKGLIMFSELHKRFNAGEKISIYTHDITNKQNPVNTVSKTNPIRVMTTGINPVYKLDFSNGLEIKTTANHRFWTKNSGWVRADNLSAQDQVMLLDQEISFEQSNLDINVDFEKIYTSGWGGRDTKQFQKLTLPSVWTSPFAEYVGYMVGDGSLVEAKDSKHRLSRAATIFGNQDDTDELLPRFESLLSDFGLQAQTVNMPNGTVQLWVNRTPFVRFLKELGMTTERAHLKHVPCSIFQTPKHITAAFLRGLFSADGCVYNGENSRYIGLGNTSKDLLKEAQQLLLSFGIFSRIYATRKPGFSFSYLNKQGQLKKYNGKQLYDLRISGLAILKFKEKIGFLITNKQEKLNKLISNHEFYQSSHEMYLIEKKYLGRELTYNLTEPKNHSYLTNGIIVANCSEYMHLDNSACNLASINLVKFLAADGSFDIEKFKNAVDTMITAQEILVSNSSYPTEKIGKNAVDFRQLGLGYANLGSLLMNMGLAYDSENGRMVAATITSIMCGEAYRKSAEIAGILGPFDGYEINREPMLRVIRKHGLAAENLANNFEMAANSVGQNSWWQKSLAMESEKVWREALEEGQKYGYRNSQATVLAPTGTIAFLMDCDTTGIEPELALIKYKKLVGGGTLKLVNSQVPSALKKLGYNEQQISEISNYLMEKETIEGAPHLRSEHLPIFDCSFKAAAGTRSISYLGHIKMMGAVQPFISGAISKTVNLPSNATVDDIRDAFMQSWKHGLKAVAIYRDGCKSVQPLNTSKEEKGESGEKNKLVEKINGYTRIKLPDERPSITHKFSIGNHEGYLTIGLYPDTKKPGETFITIAKEGSTVSGLFDVIATLTSMCLQSGVPLKTLVKKFKDLRFEPSGFTSNNEIPVAKSFIDYIFKYLGHRFLSENDREDIFGTPHTELAAIFNDKELPTEITEAVVPIRSTPVTEATAVSWNDEKDAHTDAPVCECGTMMFKAGSCYTCPNCFNTTGVCN